MHVVHVWYHACMHVVHNGIWLPRSFIYSKQGVSFFTVENSFKIQPFTYTICLYMHYMHAWPLPATQMFILRPVRCSSLHASI